MAGAPPKHVQAHTPTDSTTIGMLVQTYTGLFGTGQAAEIQRGTRHTNNAEQIAQDQVHRMTEQTQGESQRVR